MRRGLPSPRSQVHVTQALAAAAPAMCTACVAVLRDTSLHLPQSMRTPVAIVRSGTVYTVQELLVQQVCTQAGRFRHTGHRARTYRLTLKMQPNKAQDLKTDAREAEQLTLPRHARSQGQSFDAQGPCCERAHSASQENTSDMEAIFTATKDCVYCTMALDRSACQPHP